MEISIIKLMNLCLLHVQCGHEEAKATVHNKKKKKKKQKQYIYTEMVDEKEVVATSEYTEHRIKEHQTNKNNATTRTDTSNNNNTNDYKKGQKRKKKIEENSLLNQSRIVSIFLLHPLF